MLALSLLGSNDDGYIGSKACSRCHKEIYATYMRTGMGKSLTRSGQPEQLGLVPVPLVVGRFRVFRKSDGLYQSENVVDQFGTVIGETTYKLEYVIGSGVNGFAYIVALNNHLAEAPLSYYTKSKKWDISPGYENAEHGFERPIAAACTACHSGRPQPVPNRLGVYRDPPFLEMAIGCENCHGPGERHAANPAKASMVNPAKLSPAQSERICARCHQDPGAAPDADLLVNDSTMGLSKCYRASGGRMTCITCHDPHTSVPAAEALSHYRSKCLMCHTDASCSLPAHGANCIECHMPKGQLREIPHTALTNHRIPVQQ
jgi:hypothetical protein